MYHKILKIKIIVMAIILKNKLEQEGIIVLENVLANKK